MIEKNFSGGQTGVDTAALDVAIALRVLSISQTCFSIGNLPMLKILQFPATCFQFPKESTKLAVEPKAGCTLWTFDTNGVFDYEYIYT
jgi:hypothetical protein